MPNVVAPFQYLPNCCSRGGAGGAEQARSVDVDVVATLLTTLLARSEKKLEDRGNGLGLSLESFRAEPRLRGNTEILSYWIFPGDLGCCWSSRASRSFWRASSIFRIVFSRFWILADTEWPD